MIRNFAKSAGVLTLGLALAACASTGAEPLAGNAPATVETTASGPTTQDRAEQLLGQMSLERKVAQIVMPDIGSITPQDVRDYRFGTILNGGNSGPGGDDKALAPEWLALADAYWDAATAPLANGEPAVPALWATDAVHGHTNVIGATIFPHNIALGATRDAALIERIGQATAVEIEVTGIDWTFAPTIAVARDDRWGRTYESYSENPQLVATMGEAMVRGLQGDPASDAFLAEGRVAATAKHFFGDGGTEQGVDQGDVNGDLDDLKAIHVTPYPAAIDAGLVSVMASFNSINGRKMHGNGPLLTGVLRDELGFGGLVVGDWNGHGQIAGCTNSDCPQALMAGLDVYMVPEEWKPLYDNLVAQVRDGTIPMARLDEAVLRVLRLKDRMGLFTGEVKPSERALAGDWSLLGSADHRAIAREAVAKSLVILKNDGTLPLKAGADILVAGQAADDIAWQSGGWTITWQGSTLQGGGDLIEADFPGATSIFDGLAAAASDAGGSATLSADGDYTQQPDLAVVVFGEKPYAEFAGDRKDATFRDEEGLELLRRYKGDGIPTVAVFLSGRPLWMNRELNAADAFVAAWLPGSEGAGVADVLYAKSPASGALSFSWPANCDGAPVNGADGALFPFGYTRGLTDTAPLGDLDETCAVLIAETGAEWFGSGRLGDGVQAIADNAVLPDLRGSGNGITASGIDRNAQEDARLIRFEPGSLLTLSGPATGEAWRIEYAVDERPLAPVSITADGEALDIAQEMSVAAGKGWRDMVLAPDCLGSTGGTLTIRSAGDFGLKIGAISRVEVAEGTSCSF